MIVAEFSMPVDEFALGAILSAAPNVDAELERIATAPEAHVPYLWIGGEHPDEFVESVLGVSGVIDVALLDTVEGRRLYRIELGKQADEFVDSIVESDAVILEAAGADDAWVFRFYFSDHDHLARFYNSSLARGLTGVHLDRVYSLVDRSGRLYSFGLTPEQREGIVLAARRGYFSTPRAASLEELAAELGISQQALSQRIRRANEKIVRESLAITSTDPE